MSFLAEDDYAGAARPQTAAWRQPSPEQPGWAEQDEYPAYYDPGYAEPYYEPAYDQPGYGWDADQPVEYDQDPPSYQDDGDDFPGQPEPDEYLDAVPGAGVPGEYAEMPQIARPPGRPRGGRRSRRGGSGPKRAAGIVLAAASVAGVALLAPSVLTAAKNETLTGVVSQSSLDRLNFAAAGRVFRVRVRLGQVVRKGQLLAREVTPAGMLSALRTDRAAIVADKADLAALTAEGAPTASVTAARTQLTTDRRQQAADRAAMVIRAPMAGTVAAVFGRAGDTVTPAGLPSPGQQPATQLPALTLTGLRAGGRELPVIALRTLSTVQVKLLIPAQSPAALRVGSRVTLSVPAARLTRVSGVITALTTGPGGRGGGHLAVIQVSGSTPATALTGMRANVYLNS
jgi:biotin carboxyl carrier protein